MKAWPVACVLVSVATLTLAAVKPGMPTRRMQIKMPNSHPKHPETYFCTPVKLDTSNTNFIVGFSPKVSESLVYVCRD